MTGQDISAAARAFVEARRSRTQVSPAFELPDRAAVYAIQNEVARAFGPAAGWKVGAKTPTAEPNCAPLLAGSLVPSPATFDGRSMHMIGVEIEISFHIACDIPARAQAVGSDEALAAVGDAFVGMEVVDTRLANFKALDPEWLLADNQMNQALVVGTALKDWRALDWAALRVRLEIDGAVIVDQRGGLGAVDPVRPLAWMIDHAVRQRDGIRAGQAITTGSWTGLRYFPPGTRARGEFAGLGVVEATF